ncbi:hypothetical protein Tco_0716261 [Tanacetum coccineum]
MSPTDSDHQLVELCLDIEKEQIFSNRLEERFLKSFSEIFILGSVIEESAPSYLLAVSDLPSVDVKRWV